MREWKGIETSGLRVSDGWVITFTGEAGGIVRLGANGRWDSESSLEANPIDCTHQPGSETLNTPEQYDKLRLAVHDEVAQKVAEAMKKEMEKGAVSMREQSFGKILWGGEQLWQELTAAAAKISPPASF